MLNEPGVRLREPGVSFHYHHSLSETMKNFAALALLLAWAPAVAQTDWPARPVTLVNPFAAVSAVDVVARLVAQRMAANLDRPFLVDNRTGASGNIGTEYAAKAKPDVPFRGGSLATQAVIAGDVEIGVEGLPSLGGHLKAGKIRAIAVTSAARAPALLDVPAASETIKDFDASAWIILFAPVRTPISLIERMAREAARALQDPEVRTRLSAMGAAVLGSSPAQTAAFHYSELAKFKRAVELSGARTE